MNPDRIAPVLLDLVRERRPRLDWLAGLAVLESYCRVRAFVDEPDIARLGSGDAIEMTTALAGRTRHPGPIPGQVRIGGFGGVAGLADYLLAQRIDRLIDATHPFAAEISSAARLASDQARVPRLLLLRPAWRRHPLDRWIEVDSVEAAAQIVGRVGRRALLTVGAGEVAAFAPANGVRFVVRMIDPPRAPLPPRCGRWR